MLVDHLLQLQRTFGWSQAKMARELGISRSLLSQVYSGKRKPQLRIIQAIISRFPDLKQQVFQTIDAR